MLSTVEGLPLLPKKRIARTYLGKEKLTFAELAFQQHALRLREEKLFVSRFPAAKDVDLESNRLLISINTGSWPQMSG